MVTKDGQLKEGKKKLLKQWFIKVCFSYKYWLKVREQSKDEWGEKLCYCGHTCKCSCGNPDKQTFKDSVERKTVILFDKNNGWEIKKDK